VKQLAAALQQLRIPKLPRTVSSLYRMSTLLQQSLHPSLISVIASVSLFSCRDARFVSAIERSWLLEGLAVWCAAVIR
jgi:hypothetical protein